MRKEHKHLYEFAERVIQAMKLRCPNALKHVWAIETHAVGNSTIECFFVADGIRFSYGRSHTIMAHDEQKGHLLFLLPFDDPDDHMVLGHRFHELETALQRVLVLEDLAELE